jgi:transcriptional regulator with XRE-family HTH domain
MTTIKLKALDPEFGAQDLEQLLRRVMTDHGLTQQEFLQRARDAGHTFNKSSLSDWLSGRTPRDLEPLRLFLLSLGVPAVLVDGAIERSHQRRQVVALAPDLERRRRYAPEVVELVRELQTRLQYTAAAPDGLRRSVREIRRAVSEWPLLRSAMDGSWPLAALEQFDALSTSLRACAMHMKIAIDHAIPRGDRARLLPEDYTTLMRSLVRMCIGSTDPGYRGSDAAPNIAALSKLKLSSVVAEDEEIEIAEAVAGHAMAIAVRRRADS